MQADTVLIFIMGFRQDEESVTGLESIWQEARKHASPETWVIKPYHWNDNFAAETSQLSRYIKPKADIVVCAYSWGAGHGFIKLAKELEKHGHSIRAACLADPVYRSRWWINRWLAFYRKAEIKIPWNVGEVHWVRQKINSPRGANLVPEVTSTTIHPAKVLRVRHSIIDNDPFYAELCGTVIAKYAE